jgi:trigger factor
MYGKSVLVEEINKLVSNQLQEYIEKNNLNILGEALPREDEQKLQDFDSQEDYEFTFDLGLSPELAVKLTKEDKIPYYTIAVTDEMIEEQINNFKANSVSYEQANDIQGNDMAKGLLTELNEDGLPKENGISLSDAVLIPLYFKDEDEKKKFAEAKLGDTVTFNPFNAHQGNEVGLASLLVIEKDKVKDHTGNFTFEIKEITRCKEAAIDQELFDKVYKPGTVTSEEQFRNKIKENLSAQSVPQSNYKFILDVRKLLDEKTKDVCFPDAFLKRYFTLATPDRTAESIEEDYPQTISELKFQLFKNKIIEENNIEVSKEDLWQAAVDNALEQFHQYGMSNVPQDLLEHYAQEMLKKKETVSNLYEERLRSKFVAILKEEVTLENQALAIDDFVKLFEKN